MFCVIMGSDRKKKEKNDEKLRQRLLSERESRRIAQRFESLEKEFHRLMSREGSIDLQEALDRPPVEVPSTPPPPPPPPWSGNEDATPPISMHYKEAAQWNYAEGQVGTSNTGTCTTPVSVNVLWALLGSYGGVTPASDDQVTPRVPPMMLNVTGMLHVSIDLAENVGTKYL